MGTIIDVDVAGKHIDIKPDRDRETGNIYICDSDMLNELKHAWALSVHKSQGSQWRKVIFLTPREHIHAVAAADVYCHYASQKPNVWSWAAATHSAARWTKWPIKKRV